MKKLFVAMATIALTLTSCTNESTLDINDPAEIHAKVAEARADVQSVSQNVSLEEVMEVCKENNLTPSIRKNRIDMAKFIATCKSLLEVHKEFDNFRELLNADQLAMLDGERFNADIAVSIIFTWWNCEETFDVMCEYPDWDDFLPNMPLKYWDIYPFYC